MEQRLQRANGRRHEKAITAQTEIIRMAGSGVQEDWAAWPAFASGLQRGTLRTH